MLPGSGGLWQSLAAGSTVRSVADIYSTCPTDCARARAFQNGGILPPFERCLLFVSGGAYTTVRLFSPASVAAIKVDTNDAIMRDNACSLLGGRPDGRPGGGGNLAREECHVLSCYP